jgi:hypothetical protein
VFLFSEKKNHKAHAIHSYIKVLDIKLHMVQRKKRYRPDGASHAHINASTLNLVVKFVEYLLVATKVNTLNCFRTSTCHPSVLLQAPYQFIRVKRFWLYSFIKKSLNAVILHALASRSWKQNLLNSVEVY